MSLSMLWLKLAHRSSAPTPYLPPQTCLCHPFCRPQHAPPSAHPRFPSSPLPSTPAGVFAVLSFALSMLWLKLCADALVHICVLLGTIFGIPPAILGATVLAWGNSMPDLANNLSLARDGFPTMAITACFASPLFTLLVGTSSTMAYGALQEGGVLEVPFDKMLGIMYGEGFWRGGGVGRAGGAV